MNKGYKQCGGKIIEDGRFEHIMALALNPKKDYKEGIVRCIVKRIGDVGIKGFLDRSKLYLIKGNDFFKYKIGQEIKIEDKEKIVDKLGKDGDFLGFEDPDIWIDEKNGLIHLYFTIPIKKYDKKEGKNKTLIHLGQAVGNDLNNLKMTKPVIKSLNEIGAKELSVAPINSKGWRFNLVESSDIVGKTKYSVLRTVVCKDMSQKWKFGKIVLHPASESIAWIGGHVSPGPLFSNKFIDVGEGKRLGFLNGRERNRIIKDKTYYGEFTVGLFVYNYEEGKVEWISKKPFIRDNQAKTITFASQFVEIEESRGILYAHVDDSFVRGYEIKANELKKWVRDEGFHEVK